MDSATWTVIAIGVTILIANERSSRALRTDLRALGARIDVQTKRIDALVEQMAQMRERIARLEGLFEGMRESIPGRRDRDAA